MRVAVIGAGRWGRLHAEKLSAICDVELAAIVDHRFDLAQTVANATGAVMALPDLSALPTDVGVVTIAVNIEQLSTVSKAALVSGRHVFVEKPCATTPEDAEELALLASKKGLVLAGGFIERFNPALDAHRGDARRIVAWRGGPVPNERFTPVLDWMVHDLDLATYLTGCELSVNRVTRSAGRVSCTLVGPAGQEVRLTVSESVNGARRSLWVDGERYDLRSHGHDLLHEELVAYVATVRGQRDGRLALGADICRVARLVERVGRPLSIAA